MQARKEYVNVLIVQCQPRSSIGFCKKMGFELRGEAFGTKIDPYYSEHAFRTLEYNLPIPESGVSTEVNIEFRELKEAPGPFDSRTVRGRRIDDAIYLEKRFVAYFPFRTGCGCGDVYCRLSLGDLEVYSEKMKRDRFEEIGFHFEEHSEAYFADRLRL